jgi:uncharacterized membrane protein
MTEEGDNSPTPEELLPEIISELPPEHAAVVRRVFAMEMYAGPIPHPAILGQLEGVIPGSAQQILDDAHDQSQHRRDMEKIQIEAAISDGRRGQWFGFIIAMTVVVGSITLIALGQSIIGLAGLITALVGLVGLFIYSQRRGNQAQSVPETPARQLEPEQSPAGSRE